MFPIDYVSVSEILAFGSCDTRQCTEISIVDDMIVELTESFFVTLERTPDLDSRITLDPVDGEITDNDGKYIHCISYLIFVINVCGGLHKGCGGCRYFTSMTTIPLNFPWIEDLNSIYANTCLPVMVNDSGCRVTAIAPSTVMWESLAVITMVVFSLDKVIFRWVQK